MYALAIIYTGLRHAIEKIVLYEGNLPDAAEFVLQAFEGKQRKDGTPLAVHSLQLARSAQYLKVQDTRIHLLVLLHDTIEDAGKTVDELRDKFGEEAATNVDHMTERRGDQRGREYDVAVFVEKLKRGGVLVAIAELLDRIEDTSDLAYLAKKIKTGTAEEEVREQIAEKFGKCTFTVYETLQQFGAAQPAPEEIVRLKELFEALLRKQSAIYNVRRESIDQHALRFYRAHAEIVAAKQ